MVAGCGKPDEGRAVDKFLKQHWQEPVPAQGMPNPQWPALEASLAPEACGTCHLDQLHDWQTALHSRTMGPGIRWQFDKLGQAESNRCLRCHAPLAEQKALLAREKSWPNAPSGDPPAYVGENLHRHGLVCAACHVRAHVRYGPPATSPPIAGAPHGGFVPAAAFKDSRFCAHCHQFDEDGPRLAGKLREDTYAQWRESAYAPQQTCQSCHMPERRHLWRGIHDAEMVRQGLGAEIRLTSLQQGRYLATVTVRNKGAGHHLPTYLVPKITLVLRLKASGRTDVEIARDVIGWKADLNMQSEEFDTRLMAGETRNYHHELKQPSGKDGWHVELSVEVDPAEHYIRMFRYSLANVSLTAADRLLLRDSIAEAEAARFTAMKVTAMP